MVATLETEKGISYFVEGSKLKPSIDLTEITAPWDLLEIESPWMYDTDIRGTIKGILKLIQKNKIDAALGYTHYVKKGKLYRK